MNFLVLFYLAFQIVNTLAYQSRHRVTRGQSECVSNLNMRRFSRWNWVFLHPLFPLHIEKECYEKLKEKKLRIEKEEGAHDDDF